MRILRDLKMPEVQQIYPPLSNSELVTHSGNASTPVIEHHSIPAEDWKKELERTTYTVSYHETTSLVYELHPSHAKFIIETINPNGKITSTMIKSALYPKVLKDSLGETSLEFLSVDEGYRKTLPTSTTTN